MLEDLEPPEGTRKKDIERYQTAADVIGVLSLTGLRPSECRGLRWGDWDEETQVLNVNRSIYKTAPEPTKNIASESYIPVIPLLRNILSARKERIKGKPGDYIFAGVRRGAPLNFHNLELRIIRPALERSKLFKKVDGKWVKDDTSGITWKGWHAFRRGVGANLLSLGVHPKYIQAILRHSDIATTLALYTEPPDNETRAAMEKLEAKFKSGLVLNQGT
jgi:integrase